MTRTGPATIKSVLLSRRRCCERATATDGQASWTRAQHEPIRRDRSPVLACPAWSWQAAAFSAGGDGGRKSPELQQPGH